MSNSSFSLCEIAPETARSDAGVAGAGILLAFIITAGLALILSSFIVLSEIRGKSSHNISRKILSGLSDQQIIEGIGIQVVGLAKINSMVPYHFFIIWMLSLLSTATNFAALMALVQDFKRDWVLRWLRQFAMFVNMVLTIVFGIFVLETNIQSLAPTLPVVCVWREHAKSSDGQGNKTLSVIGTIAVIAASAIIFALGTWYLHMRRQIWGKVVRCVSLIVLMAMAIGAAVRVIVISQAFGEPSVKLADTGEKEWSFGQLLTMLLLLLPFVSALEIFRGESSQRAISCTTDMITGHIHVAETSPHGDSDQIPLTSSDGADLKHDNRYTYQPNPLFR